MRCVLEVGRSGSSIVLTLFLFAQEDGVLIDLYPSQCIEISLFDMCPMRDLRGPWLSVDSSLEDIIGASKQS